MLVRTAGGARSRFGQSGSTQLTKGKEKGAMLRTVCEKTSVWITRGALASFFTSMLTLLLILPAFAGDKEKDEDTLQQANLLLQGFLNDKSISPTVLSKANCVLILPGVKKFGFGVGGLSLDAMRL